MKYGDCIWRLVYNSKTLKLSWCIYVSRTIIRTISAFPKQQYLVCPHNEAAVRERSRLTLEIPLKSI